MVYRAVWTCEMQVRSRSAKFSPKKVNMNLILNFAFFKLLYHEGVMVRLC